MLKLLKPFISWWKLRNSTSNAGLAYKLLPLEYTPKLDSSVSYSNGQIIFDKYNTRFTKKQLALFGNHGELLLKYIKSPQIAFGNNEDDGILKIKCNDQNIFLRTSGYENLRVIEEIFIDRLYDFSGSGEYIVCDVGMNVAAASLFFASFPNVQKIYGYEPFELTFQAAERNLQLNPDISSKIEAYNFGLGKSDETLSVPLPAEGSLGGSTDASFLKMTDKAVDELMVNVQIKEIVPILKEINQKHPSGKILLKLDCEGAEYDIIENLQQNGYLGQIEIFMIEYHFKGPMSIKNALSKAGYFILSPVSENSEFGMLYAIKKP